MNHLKYLGLVSKLLAVFALVGFASMPAKAQENSPQNTIGAIGNLFGALAQAGAKANAERAWAKVNPQITQCANTMLSGKNVTVDQLIAAGLGPNDQRIAPIINACNAVLTAQLRTNFPCNVTNAKGQQIMTTCNESFAKEVDGSLVALSVDDVILAAGNGEKITAANFETLEAQNARLAEEKRQEQTEYQRNVTTGGMRGFKAKGTSPTSNAITKRSHPQSSSSGRKVLVFGGFYDTSPKATSTYSAATIISSDSSSGSLVYRVKYANGSEQSVSSESVIPDNIGKGSIVHYAKYGIFEKCIVTRRQGDVIYVISESGQSMILNIGDIEVWK